MSARSTARWLSLFCTLCGSIALAAPSAPGSKQAPVKPAKSAKATGKRLNVPKPANTAPDYVDATRLLAAAIAAITDTPHADRSKTKQARLKVGEGAKAADLRAVYK